MNQAKPTSTIERLDKMESTLNAISNLVKDLPAMIQAVQTLTQQTTANHTNLVKLAQDTNRAFETEQGFIQELINRGLSVEQSYAALAKTVNALVQVLSENKLIDGKAVLTNIRKYDESQEKERIKRMLAFNAIQAADITTEESVVVVSQNLILEDGTTDVISEYRVVEVSSPLAEGETNKFLDKKVGDVVDVDVEGGRLSTTVLEIYAYVQTTATEEQKEEVNG